MPYMDTDEFVAGLARAKARQAPKGYEGQSAWSSVYGTVSDEDLMRLYRQRQQDRIAAENAERSQRIQQTGLWEPTVQNNFNMAGAFEGFQHNDQAAGIDPDTGAVVTGPKSVRMLAPYEGGIEENQVYGAAPSVDSLAGLQTRRNRARAVGVGDLDTAAFSLQGLRDIALGEDIRRKQKQENARMLQGLR